MGTAGGEAGPLDPTGGERQREVKAGLRDRGLVPGGFPVPGQQLVQPGVRQRRDAPAGIGQPSLRVDIVELGGADESVHRRGALAAAVGAGEQPRFSAQGQGPERALSGIIAEAEAPVVEEAGEAVASPECIPASCITFLSEQAFAPQNTRFWSRSRVWFQFTVGEDKPPMLSVDNRGKGVLSMDCSAKRSPL